MKSLQVLCMFFLLLVGEVQAQKPVQLAKFSSDCPGAVMLNDTVIGPVYSPEGYGDQIEIYGYELGDPFFIQREHNTVWYKFIAPYDAIFTFELKPKIIDDDFDFLLFLYSGPNFCARVAEGLEIPVRTNISRKNTERQGLTGLSESAVEEYVPSGPGSPFSRALPVKKGEIYYLLVDNPFVENKGHSLSLHFKKIAPEKKPEESANPYSIPMRKLQITVKDAKTGQRISSDISIDGLPASQTSEYRKLSQVTIDVESYKTYTIGAVKDGYLVDSKTIIPKNDSLYEVDLLLKPLEKGDRINLENIHFEQDETIVLSESKAALKQLVDFLKANPYIKIQIQGHVNGESRKNKKKYRKLSEERAKAIFDKLVEAGISKSRMTYKGFGNAQMIFPNPINNKQAEANRRVEVEVISL